jgi:hypothetical protein
MTYSILGFGEGVEPESDLERELRLEREAEEAEEEE